MLLLHLDLANVAGVLNNLCDVCPVAAAHLTSNTLSQVDEAAVHPVLPEDSNGRGSNAGAEGSDVWLDHAESSMNRPEEEEHDEHVVGVPESLKVRSSRLLHGGENHAHQRNEHDIARPSWPRHKVGYQPAVDAQLVLDSDLRKVVPMGNGVDPGPEDNGPGGDDVEGDVLVELENSVERRLAQQRDEGSADGEEDDADVDVKNQRGRTCNDESEAKVSTRGFETFFLRVMDAGEGEDEGV